VLIFNVLLSLLSLIVLGKKYFLKTIIGTLLYPMYLFIAEIIYNNINLELIDPFLSVIIGSSLVGFGVGLVVKNGYNSGGVDILQAILFKKFNIPYSKSLIFIDGVIVFLGMIFINFQNGMYGLVNVLVSGMVMDNIIFGGYNKRAMFIVTNKEEEIKKYILNNLQRGLTNIFIEKGYSNKNQKMLLCVLSSKEYFNMRILIKNIDPDAFVFVLKSSEVMGLGFSDYDI
jgi:uncharacterized membrane-anchored protein YitT (DUF2179 family)